MGFQGPGSHVDERSRARTGMAGSRGAEQDGGANVAREMEGDEVVLTRPARTWVSVLIMVCFFCQ